MRINETPFAFLPDDCIREFGEEKGRKIYLEADDIFSKLEAEADYKDNEAIRNHMQMKLLPPMAYYKALLSEGYDKDHHWILSGRKPGGQRRRRKPHYPGWQDCRLHIQSIACVSGISWQRTSPL